MAKPAQLVQAIATHVQAVQFVKRVKQDMDCKVINATPVLQELTLMVRAAQVNH